jgi:hypothetical protein
VGGLQFAADPPEVSLFQAFWGSSAQLDDRALPLFVWMGEIRLHRLSEMFQGWRRGSGGCPGGSCT